MPPADWVAVGAGAVVAVAVGGATVAVRVTVGGTVVGVRVAVAAAVVGVFVAVGETAVFVGAAGAVGVGAAGVFVARWVAAVVAVALGNGVLVAVRTGVGVFVRLRHQPSESDRLASRPATGRYTELPPFAVAVSELRSAEMGRALVLGAPVRPTPRATIRQARIQATAVGPRICHLRFLLSHDGERRLFQYSAARGV
jgi:hypothetical protein